MDASFLIHNLQLQPHPEGGYFKETYRDDGNIPAEVLSAGFIGARSFSTAIYYLLQKGDFFAFHRIKSDECWHFYAGGALLIHIIENDGKYGCIKLGANIDAGETFQFVVPAKTWFASEPDTGTAYTLAGCTVAPGFDFEDFEMADKESLLLQFPDHSGIIKRLCRNI